MIGCNNADIEPTNCQIMAPREHKVHYLPLKVVAHKHALFSSTTNGKMVYFIVVNCENVI